MKLPETDAVNINALSSETRKAITNALFESGFDVGESWIDFDICCGIWFRLRYAEDSPELFPKGKWATLQRFEQLIDEAIKPAMVTDKFTLKPLGITRKNVIDANSLVPDAPFDSFERRDRLNDRIWER